MNSSTGGRAPLAWFGGRLAQDLDVVLQAADPSAVPELFDEVERAGGWWALLGSYEGALTAARFCRVEQAGLPEPSTPWPAGGRWRSSLDRAGYLAAVRDVRNRIAAGEIYQVNVCRVLERELADDADLLALAGRLARHNPAPYAGVLQVPGTDVVCASPELFLARSGELVTTGPIKGTAVTADGLLPKDVDENIMIVDLARNDLSQVCRPGSVAAVDLLSVEQHPGLVHLVSRVQGRLRPGVDWARLWQATTPPASVTGAPRSTALRAIADLEPVPRGPYCGGIGWLDVERGRAEIAVGIRSFWSERTAAGRVLRFGAGAGITWGSDPEAEWAETELKARHLIAVADAAGAL